MKEYYIVAISYPTPFVGDTSSHWCEGEDPYKALCNFKSKYTHPFGLHSAYVYEDANAESRNMPTLARCLEPRK